MFWNIKILLFIGFIGISYGLECHHYIYNIDQVDLPNDNDKTIKCKPGTEFCFKFVGTQNSKTFTYKGCNEQLGLLHNSVFGAPNCTVSPHLILVKHNYMLNLTG